MNTDTPNSNHEKTVKVLSGAAMLPFVLLLFFGSLVLLIYSLAAAGSTGLPLWLLPVLAVVGVITSIILMYGFFTLQPNEARVIVLFGAYKGTVRDSGFHWGNPFYSNGANYAATQVAKVEPSTGANAGSPANAATIIKKFPRFKLSLRARNFNSDKLKVNDKRGNPVEIGAVVVWRVHDTAQAVFDVQDFENYVRVQSESALRHLASCYAYDQGEEKEATLLSGVDEISLALKQELQARLDKAGVQIEEARLTHLAYAPEIAQAMLRRQQAAAVIAARQKIVHGAVSMVDMALKELAEKHVVQLDDERRAAMVSNLMVVLCGEAEVHPVVNTGTLYT